MWFYFLSFSDVPTVLTAPAVVTLCLPEQQLLLYNPHRLETWPKQHRQRKCIIWPVAFVAGRPGMSVSRTKAWVSLCSINLYFATCLHIYFVACHCYYLWWQADLSKFDRTFLRRSPVLISIFTHSCYFRIGDYNSYNVDSKWPAGDQWTALRHQLAEIGYEKQPYQTHAAVLLDNGTNP